MKKNIFRDLLVENLEEATVVFMGIPFDKAVSCGQGARFAPLKLRELSAFLPPVSYQGKKLNTKLFDGGDIENYQANQTDSKVTFAFKQNKFCFFVGGDHSVSIAMQKAFTEKNSGKKVGIIHVDAHADLCDIYDNNRYSHASVNRRAIDNGVQDGDIAYIGIRSWEKEEVEYYQNHPEVTLIPMQEIHHSGLPTQLDKLINQFRHHDAVYLSFDIDAIDPAYAPGTGTPEAAGMTSYQALELVRSLLLHLPIQAMDIVEVAPPLDQNDITSWLALKMMYEAFSALEEK
ncbi:MAG: agmatinase [Bacilli bacterium]|nr:agmatinase [Bacilli bacterium]